MTDTFKGAPVTWRGGKAYATCGVCEKLVQVNKPVTGGLHFCLTHCQRFGHDPETRRRGPFWRRRTETYCARCGAVNRSNR